MQLQRHRRRGTRSGSVLVTAVVVTMMIGALALMTLTISTRQQKERESWGGDLNAFYAAEAGLSAAWVELQNGGDGAVGSADAAQRLGGLSYWVAANDVEDDVSALVATGTDGNRTSRVELIVREESGEISDFGIFGDRGVTLRSNCLIDSFDSTLGTYVSQVSGDHANDNGNVGSNDDISYSSNAKTYGYAQYGPDNDDTISIAANVTISDGYGAAQTSVTLAPVVAPSYASSGSLTVASNSSRTIGPGNLQYTSITTRSNSTLTVQGPCNLVISSAATINANSTLTFDATNGPIQLYALGSFELRSNSTVSTTVKDPTQLTLNLAGTHAAQSSTSPRLDFSSNSQFYGTLYAPNLSVLINSNFELYGNLQARWLEIASNARLHFDESLADGGLEASIGYEILAWRPLDGSMAATGENP